MQSFMLLTSTCREEHAFVDDLAELESLFCLMMCVDQKSVAFWIEGFGILAKVCCPESHPVIFRLSVTGWMLRAEVFFRLSIRLCRF